MLEPRGHEVLVGAVIESSSVADHKVTFFNNVGLLGMCGHGTIGVVRTLEFLGLQKPGGVTIETPVGIVEANLHPGGSVTIQNVPSYRYRYHFAAKTDRHGTVHGDIAYGGNWFFITHESPVAIVPENIPALTDYAWDIRHYLEGSGTTGVNGAEIDHIEVCVDYKNFVLCPGGAYDRSPCGTGTSAHMACLASDDCLAPGQIWRQESIIGGVFEGSVQPLSQVESGPELWSPTITGRAFITAVGELILDDQDPFCWGIT